jgi:hypothetical protein
VTYPIVATYAATTFLGALLLFQIQPIVGRQLLPAFGGGAGVWTACLVFYQCTLLLGYVYAHVLSSHLTSGRQAAVHSALLVLSLMLLPIGTGLAGGDVAPDSPNTRLFLTLIPLIGVPFLLLSATGPLVARWYERTLPHGNPYRLFAVSNGGSLIALMGYPFVVEPLVSVSGQALSWSGAYAVFVLLCSACAVMSWRTASGPVRRSPYERFGRC